MQVTLYDHQAHRVLLRRQVYFRRLNQAHKLSGYHAMSSCSLSHPAVESAAQPCTAGSTQQRQQVLTVSPHEYSTYLLQAANAQQHQRVGHVTCQPLKSTLLWHHPPGMALLLAGHRSMLPQTHDSVPCINSSPTMCRYSTSAAGTVEIAKAVTITHVACASRWCIVFHTAASAVATCVTPA